MKMCMYDKPSRLTTIQTIYIYILFIFMYISPTLTQINIAMYVSNNKSSLVGTPSYWIYHTYILFLCPADWNNWFSLWKVWGGDKKIDEKVPCHHCIKGVILHHYCLYTLHSILSVCLIPPENLLCMAKLSVCNLLNLGRYVFNKWLY